VGPFIEGYWGEKYCLLFIDEMATKAFIKTLKSRSEVAAATLELIKKEQRKTKASLVYLRNDGAKDYKTKILQDFLRQGESDMRLPKDTTLNQMDWPRDSTSPSWTRFTVCSSMQT
jgi:hypothetical protein